MWCPLYNLKKIHDDWINSLGVYPEHTNNSIILYISIDKDKDILVEIGAYHYHIHYTIVHSHRGTYYIGPSIQTVYIIYKACRWMCDLKCE